MLAAVPGIVPLSTFSAPEHVASGQQEQEPASQQVTEPSSHSAGSQNGAFLSDTRDEPNTTNIQANHTFVDGEGLSTSSEVQPRQKGTVFTVRDPEGLQAASEPAASTVSCQIPISSPLEAAPAIRQPLIKASNSKTSPSASTSAEGLHPSGYIEPFKPPSRSSRSSTSSAKSRLQAKQDIPIPRASTFLDLDTAVTPISPPPELVLEEIRARLDQASSAMSEAAIHGQEDDEMNGLEVAPVSDRRRSARVANSTNKFKTPLDDKFIKNQLHKSSVGGRATIAASNREEIDSDEDQVEEEGQDASFAPQKRNQIIAKGKGKGKARDAENDPEDLRETTKENSGKKPTDVHSIRNEVKRVRKDKGSGVVLRKKRKKSTGTTSEEIPQDAYIETGNDIPAAVTETEPWHIPKDQAAYTVSTRDILSLMDLPVPHSVGFATAQDIPMLYKKNGREIGTREDRRSSSVKNQASSTDIVVDALNSNANAFPDSNILSAYEHVWQQSEQLSANGEARADQMDESEVQDDGLAIFPVDDDDDPTAPLDPTRTTMKSLTRDSGRGRMSNWMIQKLDSHKDRKTRMKQLRERMKQHYILKKEGLSQDAVHSTLDSDPGAEIEDGTRIEEQDDQGNSEEEETLNEVVPRFQTNGLDLEGNHTVDEEEMEEEGEGLFESQYAPQMRFVNGEYVVDEDTLHVTQVGLSN